MKNFKYYFLLLAVTIIGGMSSCTNHDFEPMSQAEIDKAKYDYAFLAYVGGTIAPTQDWGFGVTTTKGLTRAQANPGGYTFPNDADASKFLTDVPAGVSKLTQNDASVNGWIDETWSGEINVWGQYDPSIPPYGGARGGTLYVKGNCDFSNRSFYFAGNSELYLIAGATLTLNANDAGRLQENTMIYVAEGAKIVANGELKLNKGLHIYNHGTIEAEQISTNSNSVLYNVGTVNVKGKISVENDLSVFVNDGTLTASELNTAGSGKVQNNGDATIKGTTTINSNSNTWVNNGHYVTDDFNYTAGSDDVKNNCKLTVKNQFYIDLGDCEYGIGFYVDGGVVAGSFKMEGPGYIYLGSNSVFKVEGTATMNITKANYGIYGIGDDWAVFQADKIVDGAANQEYLVTYGKKLAVVTNSHFAQATEGRPYYDVIDGAVLYVDGNVPEVTIEESECNPGFVGKSTTTPEQPETPDTPDDDNEDYDLRIIGEDLSAQEAGDFDFNDVVFDVKFDATNAKIKLLAAGGTLPLKVNGHEVHEAFGVATNVMVNTNAKGGVTAKPVVIPLGIGIETASEANSKIEIFVLKNDSWQLLTATPGEPAAKIAVDTDYQWVDERVSIKEVYEHFVDWVNNGAIGNSRWWK